MKKAIRRSPYEIFDTIQKCSTGPYIELFARGQRENWILWGNQANEEYVPSWDTYKHASPDSCLHILNNTIQ